MAVNLQWGLDSTSSQSLAAMRGIVHAASADNIQASAILACEGFGATLPICEQTLSKIEHDVCPVPGFAVVGFLKVLVGYSPGDCVAHLSNSRDGQRFLALASTLVTMDMVQAARCLLSMIQGTARDHAVTPTLRHVTDLLKAIHGRCSQSGFSNEVIGCEILLREHFKTLYLPQRRWNLPTMCHPGQEAVEKLVEGIRQLYRLGPADTTKLVINPGISASWTIAFIKWCIGTLPSILTDNGRVILRHDGSKIEVVIPVLITVATYNIRVESTVPELSTLVKINHYNPGSFHGMASISIYGRYFLKKFIDDTEMARQALHYVLPYALRIVVRNLVGVPEAHTNPMNYYGTKVFGTTDARPDRRHLRLQPFPEDAIIRSVCADLLGISKMEQLKDLPHGVSSVLELSPMQSVIRTRMKKCRCTVCSGSEERQDAICLKASFIRKFNDLVSIILVLSLFDNPEGLLVSTRTMSYRTDLGRRFFDAVHCILMGDHTPYQECDVSEILRAALCLVGHNGVRNNASWVMTCEIGQAIWPAIYDTFSFSDAGYLRLFWLPGNLVFQNDAYSGVYSAERMQGVTNQLNRLPREAVTKQRYLFPGISVAWTVSARDGWLEANLDANDTSNTFGLVKTCPANILRSLADALLVEQCPHNVDAEPSSADDSYWVSGPFTPAGSYKGRPKNIYSSPTSRSSDDDSKEEEREEQDGLPTPLAGSTQVIATANSNELRMVALARNLGHTRVVIRGSACLDCCLRVCKTSGSGALIL